MAGRMVSDAADRAMTAAEVAIREAQAQLSARYDARYDAHVLRGGLVKMCEQPLLKEGRSLHSAHPLQPLAESNHALPASTLGLTTQTPSSRGSRESMQNGAEPPTATLQRTPVGSTPSSAGRQRPASNNNAAAPSSTHISNISTQPCTSSRADMPPNSPRAAAATAAWEGVAASRQVASTRHAATPPTTQPCTRSRFGNQPNAASAAAASAARDAMRRIAQVHHNAATAYRSAAGGRGVQGGRGVGMDTAAEEDYSWIASMPSVPTTRKG